MFSPITSFAKSIKIMRGFTALSQSNYSRITRHSMGLDLPYPLKNSLELFTKGAVMNRLTIAHDFVIERHGNEKRKFTSIPYIEHLEETAQLLWEATDGKASDDEYIAALFHDLLENTSTTPEEIGQIGGGKVMSIVMEVTNNNEQIVTEGKSIYLSKKMNSMSNSAFLLKLCDRLSNVINLENSSIPNEFVSKYIDETQYIIEHMNREIDDTQKRLIERITCMLIFLKLNRNL